MARQAEAERERRAKVINAEGEFQAAQKLAEAAAVIGQHPMALQLRFLQTLDGDRVGAQLDHHLPDPGRHADAVHEGCRECA